MWRPLLAGGGILAHHPFAGTWCVDGHHIEDAAQPAQPRGVAAAHGGIGRSPLDHILKENFGALEIEFVGEDKRSLGKSVEGGGGFPAGSRAGVEPQQGMADEATEPTGHGSRDHRRRVLHVIAPLM